MRALVIGSGSVLACAVVERLSSAGHTVQVAGRSSDLSLDLRDGAVPGWADEERFDAVINLAGLAMTDGVAGERDMVLVNSFGPLIAARIADAVGAQKLVHISTCYAEQPEDYRGDPLYPITKRHGEELLAAYVHRSGLPVTVLRPTHVYDDQGRCRPMQPALYWLVDEAAAGRSPQLPEPELRRDYLHIDDFSAAVLTSLESDTPGTFSVKSPAAYTFAEIRAIARGAMSAASSGASVQQGGALTNTSMTQTVSLNAQVPGFRPTVSLEQGLRQVAEVMQR